jgi:hypothetical protein
MFYARDEIPDLTGCFCEKVVKEETRIIDNGFLTHVSLHLKIKGGHWHKIIACSSLLFWYKSDKPRFSPVDNTFFRFAHEQIDLGKEFPNLIKQQIELFKLQQTEEHNQAHFFFAGGACICLQQPLNMVYQPLEVCEILILNGD